MTNPCHYLMLVALATVGVAHGQNEDRDWWNCQALPDYLMDIAIVEEDWNGVTRHETQAERDDEGGPRWRSCVPLDPPVVLPPLEDSTVNDAVFEVAGWAGNEAYCEEFGWRNPMGVYGEPVTAVFVSEDHRMCSFASYVKHYRDAETLSCQLTIWPIPTMLAVTDPDDARISYLQFPAGAQYTALCAVPDEGAIKAGAWAIYLVRGLIGPPLVMRDGIPD